jgi:hypothetical protein
VAVGDYPDKLAREMLRQARIDFELRGSLPAAALVGPLPQLFKTDSPQRARRP